MFIPLISLGQSAYKSYYENGNLKVTGTFVSVESETNLKLTISDTDKETGITKSIQGKWVKIAAEFFLGPGDKGYYEDLIEPSGVEGYVFDGFLKEERYLVHKPGVWTYYFESGVINKEVFYSEEGVIKKITYDTDGDIKKIKEHQEDDHWGRDVIILKTMLLNGN